MVWGGGDASVYDKWSEAMEAPAFLGVRRGKPASPVRDFTNRDDVFANTLLFPIPGLWVSDPRLTE